VFGCRLRTLRKECGLTQRQLADCVGLGQTYISLVERGLVPPPNLLTTAYLATALNVPVAAMLDPDTPPAEQELAALIQVWLHLTPEQRGALLAAGYALQVGGPAAPPTPLQTHRNPKNPP
jgi:transcriptional regulator with XRE-family HTH domain